MLLEPTLLLDQINLQFIIFFSENGEKHYFLNSNTDFFRETYLEKIISPSWPSPHVFKW